jgi:hypothetical protein
MHHRPLCQQSYNAVFKKVKNTLAYSGSPTTLLLEGVERDI